MKKDTQTMEALLRHKLSDYTLPVEEQDWQDFITFAAKKKSRRGGIWWVLALILVGCTGLLAYQWTQHYGSEETTGSSFSSAPALESELNGSDLSTDSKQPSAPAEPTDLGNTAQAVESAAQAEASSLASSSAPSNSAPVFNRTASSTPPNHTYTPPTNGKVSPAPTPEFLRQGRIAISGLRGLPSYINGINPSLKPDPWAFPDTKKRDKRPPFPISTLSVYFSYSQVFGQSPWSLNKEGADFVHREFAAALSSNSMSISGNGFELGFRMPVSRSFSVSGGLEYASRTQSSSFEFLSTEFPVVDTSNRIVAYVPNMDDTLVQVGMNQSYSSISLPIQVQFARSINNNLNIGLRAGIQVSRFQSKEQVQVDPLTFESSNEQKPFKTYGISYAAGMFAEYRFLRDWGMMLSVDRRYYQPIYQSGEYLNNRPKLTDFRFSLIRYL